jgi:hypothetical protein
VWSTAVDSAAVASRPEDAVVSGARVRVERQVLGQWRREFQCDSGLCELRYVIKTSVLKVEY